MYIAEPIHLLWWPYHLRSYLNNLTYYVVVVLLFYVHGKHLRSCRDGQLT